MGFYEKQWKPVRLKQVSYPIGGSALGTSKATLDWFDKLLINSGDRKVKLERYNAMDFTVDVTRALDIIAEDIASDGADDNKTFVLSFSEDSSPKKNTIKTLNSTLNLWEKKTQFDYRFFEYIREMIKNGIIIFKVNNDGSLKKLIPERIEGYKLDSDDDSIVTHYIYNPTLPYKNKNGDTIRGNPESKNVKELLDVKDLFIIKNGEGPYGESILDDIYRVWKQMQLLEDAIVIYRIVRAPERRIFYIDIGKMPMHKAESHIEKVKNKIRQKQVVRNGEVETDYNPASMQEDYYIAQSGEGRSSRVETLPGGENLGKIEDLQYFSSKLSLGLRIPASYLERQGEDNNGPLYNDGRLGTAYIAELRYVGFIQRIQKTISKSLFSNFKKFSKKRGVEIPEELEFSISPPQSFAIYKQNELDSVLLNVYSSAESIESMSKKFGLERYLKLEPDEIIANEEAKLLEMGLSPKDIKGLEEHERLNLVYGGGTFSKEEETEGMTVNSPSEQGAQPPESEVAPEQTPPPEEDKEPSPKEEETK